jgi:SAM-dependent methyltransferase
MGQGMSAEGANNAAGAVRIKDESGLMRALLRLLVAIGFGAFVVLIVIVPLSLRYGSGHADGSTNAAILEGVLLGAVALAATGALSYLLRRLEPLLDANALAQAQYLDKLETRFVDPAIVFAAGLSLFLELALIRWQSSVLVFLAFYKNFSLLACFAGLGLGYALAGRSRIPLAMVVPLLAAQFGFFLLTRIALPDVSINPFREQLTMGLQQGGLVDAVVLFLLLSVIFMLTAVTFVPVGQLCGRLMERRKNLHAYGLNLVGSLLGVVLMLAASLLWTPPLVWFALCFLALVVFLLRRPSSLIAGIAFSVVCTIVLAWWPIDPLWTRVYSPYQLVDIGTEVKTGLTLIRASGHYYQHVLDLSRSNAGAEAQEVRDYYDFPYKAHPVLDDIAIVGAGTGNDVAAALRANARHVDAIEIDPVIIEVGEQRHPEHPYQDPRVRVVNNDARTFLRNTTNTYDLVVYGLLDSHTLLSHGSSVRLDSFVYTVEGLREARNRLKPGGLLSLSFTVLSESLGRKIFLMLQDVFDGRMPLSLGTRGGNTIFLISNDPNWQAPPGVITADLENRTAAYAQSTAPASVSTDDWPFFYMPQRVYPVSYLVMIGLILALSLLLIGNFVAEAPRFSHLSFFFLGAGFMLIETKGITEMGLTFGNTWQVIGIVFAGILIMAFIGNGLVQWFGIRRPHLAYLCLLAALAAGWLAARSGGFASTPLGRFETAALLSLPLLFSGIVFSTLLTTRGHISGIMAMNLLGAIVGGLLEYNSMYLGFQALYLMAMGCYVLAMASEWVFAGKDKADAATAA